MTLQSHPVADLFPLMTDAEVSDLAGDIAAHGLREPVWLHRDGRIIDGRNRYAACQLAGVTPTTRVFADSDHQLVPFVVSLNLKRRHLSESQRAMVAARIATLPNGQRPSPIGEGVAQSQAAELLNVGKRSVERAHRS